MSVLFEGHEVIGVIVEVLFPTIGGLITLVLRKDNSKKSITQFILGYFVLCLFYSYIFSRSDLITEYSSYFYFLILLILHICKSFSLIIFKDDSIISYLNPLNIFVYMFLEVFFTGRLYTIYIYSLLMINITGEHAFLITAICLVLNVFYQTNNNFEVNNFQELFRILFSESNKNEFTMNGENGRILDYTSFLLYLEDRDFVRREKFTYKIRYVLLRKYMMNENMYEANKEYKLLDKKKHEILLNKEKAAVNIRGIIRYIWRNKSKVLKNKFRGFSTIPQQLVRTNVLKHEGSYSRFMWRRKIFIERIYVYYFFCAIEKKIYIQLRNSSIKNDNMLKTRKDVKKIGNSYLKTRILYSYYVKILSSPEDDAKLINNMIYKVKTSLSRKELESRFQHRMRNNEYFYTLNMLRWDLIEPVEVTHEINKLF